MSNEGPRFQRSLERAFALLDGGFGAKVALVGGLAVSARTEPRFTRDIDFALAVADDAEAESVVHFMLRSGYQTALDVEQTGTGRLATVRLVHPDAPGVFVDLLFASSGIEREIVDDAEALEIFGQVLKVARVPHLLATKLLSQSDERMQDRQDLVLLMSVATSEDLEETERLLRLIEERGYHRNRDLQSLLSEFKQRDRRDRGAEQEPPAP